MSLADYVRLIDRDAESVSGKDRHLFSDYLPRKGVALLIGRSGVGKSFWALHLATCLATGQCAAISPAGGGNESTDFAKPAEAGATLYIAGEGAEGLPDRIIACEQAWCVKTADTDCPSADIRLPIIPMSITRSRLTGAEQVLEIWQTANAEIEAGATRGLPVRLLVFDTLISAFYIRDENSNSEMQSVVTSLRRYAETFDCLVLAIVHPGKGRGVRRQGVRGASALANGADVVLSLERGRDAYRRLAVVKMRDGNAEGRTYDFELADADASAVMRPVRKGVSRHVTEAKGQELLSERAMELLSVIEKACESSSIALENLVGLQAKAASLAHIERAWVSMDMESSTSLNMQPTKANTLRKRAERLMPELIEAGLIDRAVHDRNTYYVPSFNWDDMKAMAKAAHATS